MDDSKAILITGANGFLGRHLCDYFARNGFAVRGLVRRPDLYPFREPGIQLFRGNLPGDIDEKAFQGVQAVIHGAYTTQLTRRDEAYRVNHIGTMRVYELAHQSAVEQFVFISSIGAHAEAESFYGKSKFELEGKMDPYGDLIIRPGLILGEGNDGSFNRMKATLRKSGVVPIFDGGRQILQVIHVEDLCRAIGLAIQKKLTGLLVVADPKGVEMKTFFKAVADKLHKKCILVSLPLGMTLSLLRLIEALRIPFPLTSENLLGLKQMKHAPSLEDLKKIGLEVKGFEEALDAAIPEAGPQQQ